MLRKTPPFIWLCRILVLITFFGCKKEIVPKAFYPRSAYEAYQHSLLYCGERYHTSKHPGRCAAAGRKGSIVAFYKEV
jgi:hypothetical protein